MIFYLIGIDHKSASLDVREALYRQREAISSYSRSITSGKTATLITCNRIELYGILENFAELDAIKRHFRSSEVFGSGNTYFVHGREDVFKHGLRLASGLESQLRGEFQIFKQLKSWVNKEGFPRELFNLWNAILQRAHTVREISGLGEDVVNVSDAVFTDLAKQLNTREKKEIIVIGTGKIAELIARRKPDWVHLTFVARKNRIKVLKFTHQANDADIVLPDEIPERLISADALISATSSPHYALKKEQFQGVVSLRTKPLYIYDLAVPRDVAPEVGTINFVSVINLESVVAQFIRRTSWLRQRLNISEKLTEEALNEYTSSKEDSYRLAF